MASPIGHALAGAAVCALVAPREARLRAVTPWALAALAGAAADLDFLPGLLVGDPSRYHHWASHSLLAALAFGALAALAGPASLGRPVARAAWLGLAYASHLLLDVLTFDRTPPQGIPLFWPWSDATVMASTTVFRELIHGRSWAAFVNWHNAVAVGGELLLLGPPVALLVAWRLGQASRRRARVPRAPERWGRPGAERPPLPP